MIVDRIAQTRPDLALELMWRFMDLAEENSQKAEAITPVSERRAVG